MSPLIFAGLLLLGGVGETAGLALSGWQEPDHNITAAALDKRAFGIAVISTRLDTIYLNGDPRKSRTADFGFDFRIGDRVWAPCPVTVVKSDDCMVGLCVDNFLCSKGCGFPDRTTLSTLRCTRDANQFCSTAFLTIQKAADPVTNYACANDVSEDNYMGFTTDPPLVEALTTSTSTTFPLSTTSTSSEPSITRGPAQSSIRSSTKPPSSSPTSGAGADQDTASNSAGASNATSPPNNTGAIIGGVAGCLALVCGFGLAVVWLLRRNRNANAESGSAPSSSLHEDDGSSLYAKPELEACERERTELFGQSLAEMSARGPAAYDTSSYRPNYPPMTPVELPTARESWI
ncbi:hypothetical protein C8A01DRAFT_17114 [Parachaetomium inaequale]|uniref:Uncharacterized protein n=1 Tax=Parachaetomium inaequale TaxID=2588326 RepID=A0AAN6PF33_9PEZI|nr:hypothetical protein C8A01DRAFT_17114 [Parachaetomium inaequale]